MACAKGCVENMIAGCCVQALQHWMRTETLLRAPRPSYCRKTPMRALSRTIHRRLQVLNQTRTKPELLALSTAELLMIYSMTLLGPSTDACLSVHPLTSSGHASEIVPALQSQLQCAACQRNSQRQSPLTQVF